MLCESSPWLPIEINCMYVKTYSITNPGIENNGSGIAIVIHTGKNHRDFYTKQNYIHSTNKTRRNYSILISVFEGVHNKLYIKMFLVYF